MAAAQLTVPAGTIPGPAAGNVTSTLLRVAEKNEQDGSPSVSLDLRLQAVARCWGA